MLNDELEKKTFLYRKKLASKPEIDKIKKELLQLEQNAASASYEYDLTVKALENPENLLNLSFRLKKDSKDLKTEIERLKNSIAINKQDLDFSRQLNGQNMIKAPFDSVSVKFLAFKGNYIKEKMPVVALKQGSDEKFIEGYLKETDALKLKFNSGVNVEVPFYGIKFKGTLTQLEKSQKNSRNNLTVATIKPENPGLLKNIKAQKFI